MFCFDFIPSYMLNTLLIVFGALGSAVALYGDTFRKGNIKFYSRLTWTGWIALFCLLAASWITLCKHFADEKEKNQEKIKAAQLSIKTEEWRKKN